MYKMKNEIVDLKSMFILSDIFHVQNYIFLLVDGNKLPLYFN